MPCPTLGMALGPSDINVHMGPSLISFIFLLLVRAFNYVESIYRLSGKKNIKYYDIISNIVFQ